MKTSSCKAKGRRAASEARDAILRWFPDLKKDDIRVTPSGCTGEDLLFSPAARAAIPLTVECKNVEALNIWKALEQSKQHAKGKEGVIPSLIFRRNRTELHIAMSLEDFLALVGVFDVTKTQTCPHETNCLIMNNVEPVGGVS